MEARDPELQRIAEAVAKLELIADIQENKYIRNTCSIRLKSLERSPTADPETMANLQYEYEMSKFFIKIAEQAKVELEAELDAMLD